MSTCSRRFATSLLALALIVPAAFATPANQQPASPAPAVPQDEAAMPPGSADYSKMLAAVIRYKKGQITFAQLQKIVVDAKLPPHRLNCGYLIMPVPMPPPGVPYNPAVMPSDWEHTFGEVTMTYWAGKITREEYDRLHDAAHHTRRGFPNCVAP